VRNASAFRIATGSRPPDLRYDVSGDGSVTSLDALMILQAAAGSTVRFGGPFGHPASVDCE